MKSFLLFHHKHDPLAAAPSSTMMEIWNGKALYRLVWPLIIEQVLAVTMGAADTVMMSFVGEHAVSGVNIIDNINNLLIIAFGALCTGGAVVVSQYIGRRDQRNAAEASKQLLYTAAVISVVIMIISLVLRGPIVTLFYGRLEKDVWDAAQIYFLITALSFPALAVYNANAALFRAVGNSKITMIIALMVNILNIGGNAFFIYVMKIGVTGAALSTLICRAAAAVVTLILLRRGHARPITIEGLLKIKFIRPMIRRILNVGVPSGLESSMFQIGRLLTQRIFPTFGTAAIAGNAIAGVINSFSFMPGSAYGIAILTIVGQCVGAADYAAARRQTKRLMLITYVTLIILSGLILIFLEPLISLFNLSAEAHAYARLFLQVHCISMMIGWGISFALPNALRAAGDAKYVMWVATISMWIVRVSLSYLLAYPLGVGPLAVWIAMGCDFLSRGGFYVGRWVRGKWQTKKVI